MFQEPEQKQKLDHPTYQLINRLKSMATLLIEEVQRDEEETVLQSHQKIFTEAVDSFWHNVKSGVHEVKSVGAVKIIRDLACLVLPTRMHKPHLECKNILRELNLIINTTDLLVS
ncbi:MAG: hypothetical protein PVG65_06935 [Candidatus Thorarchaeota archaeon]|jgi:hypothetical protein